MIKIVIIGFRCLRVKPFFRSALNRIGNRATCELWTVGLVFRREGTAFYICLISYWTNCSSWVAIKDKWSETTLNIVSFSGSVCGSWSPDTRRVSYCENSHLLRQ